MRHGFRRRPHPAPELVRAPGDLSELGESGRAAWDKAVEAVVEKLRDNDLWSPLLSLDPEQIPEVRAPDWPAFPARLQSCLGWQLACQLLDWRPQGEGDVGRIRHQEEYLEWRVVREDRTIKRVEMTTELPEYWRVLAAHEPEQTLELIAELAGEDEVPWEAIYGGTDPRGSSVTPDERGQAFARTMLADPDQDDRREALRGVSEYNDGRRAICCLIHRFNRLFDLVRLVSTSARPFLVTDSVTGRVRFPSGSESIVGLKPKPVAEDGRHSDPLIVERAVQFATEGRLIGFDDPVGIYIRGFQDQELVLASGEPPPPDWFEPGGDQAALSFSRGLGPGASADGRPRYQRLTLELPPDSDLMLGDLVIRRTGEPVRFGAQLAALTQLVAYVRTGPAGAFPSLAPHAPAAGSPDCQEIRTSWEEARSAGGLG